MGLLPRALRIMAEPEPPAPRPAFHPALAAAPRGGASSAYAARIRALAAQGGGGCAFQSVAAAACGVLQQVAAAEEHAFGSALSLAQQQKLQEMIGELDEARAALKGALQSPGMSADAPAPGAAPGVWWFALTESLCVIEEAVGCIRRVVARQPRGCATRTLGGILMRMLHRHHARLLVEAGHWIGHD